MRGLVAVAAVAAGLAVVGCGGSDKDVSPAQAIAEDAELIRVGQLGFLKLDPGTQSPEVRRAIALITGGKWVESGLIIPPGKIDGLCGSDLLSAESCKALGH